MVRFHLLRAISYVWYFDSFTYNPCIFPLFVLVAVGNVVSQQIINKAITQIKTEIAKPDDGYVGTSLISGNRSKVHYAVTKLEPNAHVDNKAFLIPKNYDVKRMKDMGQGIGVKAQLIFRITN